MIDALLFLLVVGMMMLAITVDVATLIGWLRGRA